MEKPSFYSALKTFKYKITLAKRQGYIGEISITAANLAIEALEKQVPKKSIANTSNTPVQVGHAKFKPGTTFYTCPICGMSITAAQKYCSECGQRLE